MSANTGRARSYSAALAEATNENGLVMTSSPSLHADRAQRQVQPGGAAARRRSRAARRRARRTPARTRPGAGRATAAPSAAPRAPPAPRPRRAPAARAGSARPPDPAPRAGGCAPASAATPGRVTATPARAGSARAVAPGCMPYSSESTSASQEAAMRFSETPIEPHTSWPSEASISTRVTAPVPFVSSRMRTLKLTSSMSRRCGWISPIAVAQRAVERVHRAVALGACARSARRRPRS